MNPAFCKLQKTFVFGLRIQAGTVEAEMSQNNPHDENDGARPTFYIRKGLLMEVDMQTRTDQYPSRSEFIARLLSTILESEEGLRLRAKAVSSRQTLPEELREFLSLLDPELPFDEIDALARRTQRSRYQMMVNLILQGLATYKVQEGQKPD